MKTLALTFISFLITIQAHAIDWADLRGWEKDNHAEALSVFLLNCEKKEASCIAASKVLKGSHNAARKFFEQYFSILQLKNPVPPHSGLITGYYQPLLMGSKTPSVRTPFPVYARPNNLVEPYFSRAEIDGKEKPLSGYELLWVDDMVNLFFLHIQGSGLVEFENGQRMAVAYDGNNGHPYFSIGRALVQSGEMNAADINLFSLKKWLRNHPQKTQAILNMNPRYIFFRLLPPSNPIGAQGVTLTPERSLAVDTEVVPLGSLVWLDTVYPDDNKRPLRRLMIAQDTGSAIKGKVRADFFWGVGEHAERMAGLMKSKGSLYILIPRSSL